MNSLSRSFITFLTALSLVSSPVSIFAQSCYPPLYAPNDCCPGPFWWCDTNWLILAGAAAAGGIAGYYSGEDRGRHGHGPRFLAASETLSILIDPLTIKGETINFNVSLIAPNLEVTFIDAFTAGDSPSGSSTFNVSCVIIGDYTLVVTLESLSGPPTNFVTITPIINDQSLTPVPLGANLANTGNTDTFIIPITM